MNASLPLMEREARDAGGIPERWPEGPEEVFRAGRPFPEWESESPSFGLFVLS